MSQYSEVFQRFVNIIFDVRSAPLGSLKIYVKGNQGGENPAGTVEILPAILRWYVIFDVFDSK